MATMKKQNRGLSFLDQLSFEPLEKKNWNKFVQLFGDKGACGNCWCMYYRLSKSAFQEGKADDGNKTAMKNIVWANKPAGLLGLYEGRAIAWCAFAPREDFIKLENSRVQEKLPDTFAWIGLYKSFERAGFEIVDRTSKNRPMVRYYTDKN